MHIHRTLAVAALTALALPGCQRGSGRLTDADRNAITARIADFDKSILARDWPAVVSAYTEDAVLFPPNAPIVKGRAAIRQFFSGFPKIMAFKQSPTEIEGLGDLAYPWGTYEMTMIPPGAKAPQRDQGKVLSVWRRQPDGSWLASRVSWNSDLVALPHP